MVQVGGGATKGIEIRCLLPQPRQRPPGTEYLDALIAERRFFGFDDGSQSLRHERCL
jgi:hypothetical protein